MISDKTLKRAIKTAVKHGVCVVQIDEDQAWFAGDRWLAVTDIQNMRDHLRETMGYIVEMLGYLPEMPVNICKVKNEYVVSDMLEEVAEAQRNGYSGYPVEEVMRVPVVWRGQYLFQGKGGRLYACEGGAPHCACRVVTVNAAGCIMTKDEDNGETVYATAATDELMAENERLEFAHLQELNWCEWVERNEAEQTEMEDEDEG